MISLEKLYRPKDRHLGGMRLLHKSFMFYLSFVMQVFNHDHILNFRKKNLDRTTNSYLIDLYRYSLQMFDLLNNSEYHILRFPRKLRVLCRVYC